MEETTLPEKIDYEMDRVLRHIFNSGFGNPVALSAIPTTAGKDLKANQSGFYGTKLYVNLGGTTYSISLTAV